MHLVLLSLLLSSATLPVSGWVLAPASPRLQNAGRWGGASSTTTDTSFYRIGFRCTATAAASNLELWLDARTEAGLDSISAYSDRADRVLLAKDQLEAVLSGGGVKKGLLVTTRAEDGQLHDGSGRQLGVVVHIDSPEGQSLALSLVGSVSWVVAECSSSSWMMIPAENLVSVAQRSPTSVCVRVDEATQVKGAAFALQSGVDALLLPPQEDVWREAEVGKMERQRNDVAAGEGVSPHLELESARVTSVVQGGVGDRVCIDLISNLGDGEGMLLGSSAKLLSLVHAETLSTGFVPARPFRVNAGPVHSYVMMADLSTKYLSEIRAGDEVLVISPAQPPRSVMVGRSKVEPRPMLMVSFELTRTGGAGALAGNIFLQQAETVRLIGPASEDANGAANVATSVTALKEGDEIYVRAVSEGTHIGRRIDSEVREL